MKISIVQGTSLVGIVVLLVATFNQGKVLISIQGIYAGSSRLKFFNDDPSRRRKPCLAFVHLPKCGGTSLWDLIHRQANESGLKPYVLEPGKPTWVQLKQEERDETDVFGSDHINYFQLLKTWPKQSKDKSTKFVTLFRDPRQRLASHYFFVKKNKGHHSYPFVENRTFGQFVKDVQPGYYVQFFIEESRWHKLTGDGKELRPCCFNQSHVEEVKILLKEKFDVVGILEELNKTMSVLDSQVPWINSTVQMNHLMQTSHEMPPFEEQDMVRATSLDQQLYDYAKELLYEKYDSTRIGGLTPKRKMFSFWF